MSSLLFLDVNLWVALTFDRHAHHVKAKEWYETVPATATFVFCRQTQLGLFRILTTAAVMHQNVLTQRECWQVYDRWIATGQVAWADEPGETETRLRGLTQSASASPKAWMDAYLTAFADGAKLTLVTFDKALAGKAKRALLLV
jgi:toxin-antitoxin system PIN domain toxin